MTPGLFHLYRITILLKYIRYILIRELQVFTQMLRFNPLNIHNIFFNLRNGQLRSGELHFIPVCMLQDFLFLVSIKMQGFGDLMF